MVKKEVDFIGNAQALDAIGKALQTMAKNASGFSDKLAEVEKYLKNIQKLIKVVEVQKAINIDKGLKELTRRMEQMTNESLRLGEKTNNYTKRLDERIQRETKAYDLRNDMMQERMRLDNSLKRGQEQQRADNIMAHSNAISERRLKEEEMKTGRARTSMIKKIMGGFAGGDLFGGLETGAGLTVGAGMTGAELGGERIKEGFGVSKRILNFQKGISGGGETSIGTPIGSPLNKIGSMLSKFPALQKAVGGEKGSEGGGIMGKAGKGAGKLGGIAPLLAGGAAGLIGGIIMKGLESSPMFKAMSKIIGQAFSLYLRPIGDLVGGVFKPLIVPMMKMAAANAKAGSKLIKTGENIGKGLVAVFSNPAGFINAALLDAVDGMHVAISEMLHPVYVALNSLTFGFAAIPEKFMGTENRLGDFIDDTYAKWVADIDAAFGSVVSSGEETTKVISGIGSTIETGQDKANEILEKTYTVLGKEMAGTPYARSEAGQATGLFDEEGNLIKEELENAGTIIATTIDGVELTLTKSAIDTANEASEQLTINRGTTATTAVIAAMFEQAAINIKKRLDALIAKQIKVRTTTDSTGKTTIGKADADLLVSQKGIEEDGWSAGGEAFKQQYASVSGAMVIANRTDSIEKQRKFMEQKVNMDARKYALDQNNVSERIAVLQSQAFAGTISWEYYNKTITKLIETALGSSGNINISTEGASILRAVQAAKDKGILGHTKQNQFRTAYSTADALGDKSGKQDAMNLLNPERMAEGGIISEPIFGIGRSGKSYLLGESGAERITPLKSSEGGVNVVINIAKMSNTVDLQQIKPIIERALRETHSRRGII